MMKELEFWDEVKEIGILNMEMELVVAEEPVLFVCSLEENPEKKYLIMTYNSLKGKYVMRAIDNQELLLMLENEVTMEETFRNGNEIVVTYFENGSLHAKKYNSANFTEKMLPRKGAYYNIHSRYILDYIESLKEKKYHVDLKIDLLAYYNPEINNFEIKNDFIQEFFCNFFSNFKDDDDTCSFDITADYKYFEKQLVLTEKSCDEITDEMLNRAA